MKPRFLYIVHLNPFSLHHPPSPIYPHVCVCMCLSPGVPFNQSRCLSVSIYSYMPKLAIFPSCACLLSLYLSQNVNGYKQSSSETTCCIVANGPYTSEHSRHHIDLIRRVYSVDSLTRSRGRRSNWPLSKNLAN